MSKIKKKPILLFLIVLVALYVVIYVVPKVTGALKSSYTVEYGELQTYDKADGYFVRNEKVYFSGKGGSENRYMSEGKLVRKGTTVMAVEGSSDAEPKSKFESIRDGIGSSKVKTDSFVTEDEGIVTYYADGYESKFTPDNMAEKSYSDYRALKNDDLVELSRSSVAKGDPVFKIVDRSGWYIVCYVPSEHKDRYKVNGKVSIVVDGSADLVGRVSKIKTDSGKTKLMIRTDYYYKKFATQRVAEVKLITSDAMGLVIYNSSITKKDGNEGVYVKQKTGEYKFTRIKVISTDGKKSVIVKSYFYDSKGIPVSSVKSYDEVLRRA